MAAKAPSSLLPERRNGKNGVPSIPISDDTGSLDPNHHTLSPTTTTSHKAARPPVEEIGKVLGVVVNLGKK